MALGSFKLSGVFSPQIGWSGTWTEDGVVTVKPNNFRYARSYDDALTHPASWPLVNAPGLFPSNVHPAFQGSSVSVVAASPSAAAATSTEPTALPAVSEWRGSFAVVQPNGKYKSYSDKFLLAVLPAQSDPLAIKVDGRGSSPLGAYNLHGEFNLVSHVLSMAKFYTGVAKPKSPIRPRNKFKERLSGNDRLSKQLPDSGNPATVADQPRGVRERKRTIMFDGEDPPATFAIASSHLQGSNHVASESASLLHGITDAAASHKHPAAKRKFKQHKDLIDDLSSGIDAEQVGSGSKRKRFHTSGLRPGTDLSRHETSSNEDGDNASAEEDGDSTCSWSEVEALGFLRKVARQTGVEEEYVPACFDDDDDSWIHDILVSVFDDASADQYAAAQGLQHRQRWVSLCGLEPRVSGFLTKRRRKAESAFRARLGAVMGSDNLDLSDTTASIAGVTFQLAGPVPPEAGSCANELYEGETLGRVPHGCGTCIMKNGLMYEGTWFQGKEYGWGVLSDADDNVLYEGEFADGELNGVGLMRYPCGDLYLGGWRAGLAHGKGIYMSADCAFYDGEWADGLRHGHGIKDVREHSSYTGQWRFGQKHGRGEVLVTAVAAPSLPRATSTDSAASSVLLDASQKRSLIDVYSGEPTVATHYRGVWALDSMDGRADITYGRTDNGGLTTASVPTSHTHAAWAAAERYEGSCKDGRRDGRGTYTFADGQALTGKWRSDALEDKDQGRPVVPVSCDWGTAATAIDAGHSSTGMADSPSEVDRGSSQDACYISTDGGVRPLSEEAGDKEVDRHAGDIGAAAMQATLSIPRPLAVSDDEYIIPLHTGDLQYIHRAAGFSTTGQ